MTDDSDSGDSTLCPSCGRYFASDEPAFEPRLTCPHCGHRWKRPARRVKAVVVEEDDPWDDDGGEAFRRDAISTNPTLLIGLGFYLSGAVMALCMVPDRERGITFPITGWGGVVGAILLGLSPRRGVVRSLGLIGVWMSGLFIGKHPILFLFGSAVLLTGIALIQAALTPQKPTSVLPPEE